MTSPDRLAVSLQVAAPRAFARVRARLPLARVPAVFADYLNQVYAAGQDGTVLLDGQNIFVYRGGSSPGDEVDVEFGVGVKAPFASAGPVIYSQLPTGKVAAATHWGDYAKLRDAHAGIIAWCRAQKLDLAGPRWEVYGHWTADPSRLRTDVYYLLEPSHGDTIP